MTTINKPVAQTETKLTPFLKLGEFNPDDYKPADLKRVTENEKKYGTLRLAPGDRVEGTISGFYDSTNGEVMYLKNAVISRLNQKVPKDTEVDIPVKLGLYTDLKFKVKIVKKKQVNDLITIEYLGKQQSPKDASRMLHKVNVE